MAKAQDQTALLIARGLDISKLKSQQEEMKRNSEGEQHVVYGYIRGKDTKYGKAGSLYYVGIADDGGRRPYQVHRPGIHGVPVPKDKRQIRQLAVAKTRAEAERIEKALIAREGRIPIKGEAGLGTTGRRGLLNVSSGGGTGPLGAKPSKATRAKISESLLPRREAAAARLGVPFDVYEKMSLSERSKVKSRYSRGHRGAELLKDQVSRGPESLLQAAAEKYEIPLDVWSSFSSKQRVAVATRYSRGKRGADLTKDLEPGGINPKLLAAAKKYGVAPELWASLSAKKRAALAARYKKGKRGAALFEGLL